MNSTWAKSGYSKTMNCLEARHDGSVQVRDTWDREGPVLLFTPDAWDRFLARLRG